MYAKLLNPPSAFHLIMNAASNTCNRASLQYCQISEIALSDSAAPILLFPQLTQEQALLQTA